MWKAWTEQRPEHSSSSTAGTAAGLSALDLDLGLGAIDTGNAVVRLKAGTQ